MMQPIRALVLCLLAGTCLLGRAEMADAQGDTLEPLGLFYYYDTRSLGAGTLWQLERPMELSTPSDVLEARDRLLLGYMNERTLNEHNEDMKSWQSDVSVKYALPFNSAFAITSSKFYSKYSFTDPDVSDAVESRQNVSQTSMVFAIQTPFALSVAGGTDSIGGDFHGIEVELAPGITAGYSSRVHSMGVWTEFYGQSVYGTLDYDPSARRHATFVRLDGGGADIRVERWHSSLGNGAWASLRTPPVVGAWGAVVELEQESTAYIADIFVNETSNGHAITAHEFERITVGLSEGTDDASRRYAGLSTSRFYMSADGKVSGLFEGFLSSILFGERYYNSSFETQTAQAHYGAERRHTENVSTSWGLRLMDTTFGGTLVHWLPTPIVGIGQYDLQTHRLQLMRVQALGLSGGIAYRRGRLEVAYSIAQIVPFKVVKRGEAAAGAAAGDSASEESRELADRILEGLGGNIQRITVGWSF